MQWKVRGERVVYHSDWVSLDLADVELPNGERFEHHVVRMPGPAVGVVVHESQRGILLLRRHRFITDKWGWEIPAGRVDAGESPEQAAARETVEETGWRTGRLSPLCSYYPMDGLTDQRFDVFLAAGASHEGAPRHTHESERVEWVPVPRVREWIAGGEIVDGFSLTGLLWALHFGPLR